MWAHYWGGYLSIFYFILRHLLRKNTYFSNIKKIENLPSKSLFLNLNVHQTWCMFISSKGKSSNLKEKSNVSLNQGLKNKLSNPSSFKLTLMTIINTSRKNSYFRNNPNNMTLKMIQMTQKVHKLEWLHQPMKQNHESNQPLFQSSIKDKKYPQLRIWTKN